MEQLNLNNVTLLCVDDLNINGSIGLFSFILGQIKFGDAILFSSKEPISPTGNPPFLRKCDPINSIFDYNKFLIKEAHKYINTTHVMIVQRDGYPVNLKAWTDTFLLFDYIGASWANGLVGNGGFSLRSKRLLVEASKHEGLDFNTPEDTLICHSSFLRSRLLRTGMKFAPCGLANLFSIENGRWNGQFGFHGRLTCEENRDLKEFEHGCFLFD